mgnify:CR=1 FL=1
MSNHDRMEYLRDKIDEYRGYISELEEVCSLVNNMRAEIQNNNEEPIRRFDISAAGEWKGNLESEAEDYKNEILYGIAAGQSLASDFISDVQNIIEKLHERIDDYEDELSRLEAAQDDYSY